MLGSETDQLARATAVAPEDAISAAPAASSARRARKFVHDIGQTVERRGNEAHHAHGIANLGVTLSRPEAKASWVN